MSNFKDVFKDKVKNYKETFLLKGFGLAKIPMLFYLAPKVIEMNDEYSEIVVPLNYFTRNHLKSMYFGSLCAAADCCAGLAAMKAIREATTPVNFVFKDFHAEFLKRCEGDTHFICTQNAVVKATIEKCIQSKEREEASIEVLAKVPSKMGDEIAAKFILTMSVKVKTKK